MAVRLPYWRTHCLVATVVVVLIISAAPAAAHFLLNLNVRIFHVDHRADGLTLLVRMPMPYVVAEKLGAMPESGLPDPAPFTTNAMEGERLVHYVDWDALRQDSPRLGEMLADGLMVEAGGESLAMEVMGVRVHRLGSEPGFATLDEAEAVFDAPAEWLPADTPDYVGDAVVDVHFNLPTGQTVSRYRLSSRLDPGLPGQEDTANLLLDNWPGQVMVFRARGLLDEPIEVSRSSLAAFGTFVWEGVRHILEGLDHVLFVLCLAVGARTFAGLLWRVTGFTLGHSVTLSLGFFGYVPSGDWFVPVVELIIAVTIIYAAYVAVRPPKIDRSERSIFLVTGFIGLIHGLGFSFVLQNILKVSSPNIWQSLLAFNIGIELGQVFIVAVAALAVLAASRVSKQFGQNLRIATAGLAAIVAAYWVVERSIPIIGIAGSG